MTPAYLLCQVGDIHGLGGVHAVDGAEAKWFGLACPFVPLVVIRRGAAVDGMSISGSFLIALTSEGERGVAPNLMDVIDARPLQATEDDRPQIG